MAISVNHLTVRIDPGVPVGSGVEVDDVTDAATAGEVVAGPGWPFTS